MIVKNLTLQALKNYFKKDFKQLTEFDFILLLEFYFYSIKIFQLFLKIK